jgi:hypothetical protein
MCHSAALKFREQPPSLMKNKSKSVRNSALALCSLSSSLFAAAPAYKVDSSFGQDQIKSPPVCISIDAKDQLYVLLGDGSVAAFDATGKLTGKFKSAMKPAPTTMTVADGKIYLFNTQTAEKVVEFRGKKVTRIVANGIGCSVFDPAGTKVSELKLPEVTSAADAHFIGDELAIGDLAKSQIVYFAITGTEGKVTRKITKGFRLCCGIFDFCPGTAPDSLVVANLGAFKVQTFIGGEKKVEFGQRGTKAEEFHGCCNPVNVACLADGSIVTVEKSPTRVKIYDPEGKASAKVTGLTELVEGCSTIPITVDSKGTLYLASDSKNCIVKCVPGVSDKPEPPEPVEDAMDDEDLPEMSAGMKEVIEKIIPLIENEDFAKAMTEAEAIMKAHPEMTEDEKAQVLLGISVSPLMKKGDTAGALKQVDAVFAAHPKCSLAKEADSIKESIKEQIEMMKEMEAEETADEDRTEIEPPVKP